MPSSVLDLRDTTSKYTSHPLNDPNVVVIDPDTGTVIDSQEAAPHASMPPKQLLAVPRTTWY